MANNPPPREIPADFAEFIKTHAPTAAARKYKAGWNTIHKWARTVGVDLKAVEVVKAGKPLANLIPVPADYAQIAAEKIRKDLYAHYNVTKLTVDRWIEETGIQPLSRYARLVPVRQKPEKIVKQYIQWKPVVSRSVDWSSAGKAAEYLRRFFSNVHRCDIQLNVGSGRTWGDKHGVANHGKGFWNVDGKGVLTAEQVVCLAKEKGFSV